MTSQRAKERVKTRKCRCEWCVKWSPLWGRIMSKLDEKDKKLFNEFGYKIANDSDSLGAATAKLNGDWPGWEWMKQAVKDHAGWAND